MSTHSDPQSEAATDLDAGESADGTGGKAADAADAAGFGGITWADGPDDTSSAADDGPDGGKTPGHDAQAETDPGPAGAAAPSAENPSGNSEGSEVAGVQADGRAAPGPAAAGGEDASITVEDLVQDLERVTGERDQYLDASRRLQAEFENYKKAVAKRELDARERANESLVSELLPVLDACDGALASGAADVEPVRNSLIDALTKQGLARIEDQDEAFDPERHEAVMHEPDEGGGGPVVAEVMRAGYSWKGRVVRPAMVRVRG